MVKRYAGKLIGNDHYLSGSSWWTGRVASVIRWVLGTSQNLRGRRRLEPAASAVTVTISLVTNRKHAARMALRKRFSKVRKQFVDC